MIKQGHRIREHRVARLMGQDGIRAKTVKKWRATTQSQHQFPIATNTLDRMFTVAAPNPVWAGDITYIWTVEGWLYLAVLLDLYSRRVIGWAMSHHLIVDLAERALANRVPLTGLLHHPGRGSQGAFKWSLQHLDEGGCDEHSKAPFGSVWAAPLAVTRSTVGGRPR